MVEPIFKAPLPPSDNTAITEEIQNIQKSERKDGNSDIKQKLLPYLWYAFGGVFFLGLILGIMVSGGAENNCASTSNFMLNAIENPAITSPLPLCGQDDPSKECILFLMNRTKVDQMGDTFFDEAAEKMGRNRSFLKIDNALYSHVLIPPGCFAMIKIPSLR